MLEFVNSGIYFFYMKKYFFILSLVILSADLNAQTDRISICVEGLSIHPENQRDFALYYDRKLDSNGDLVITPGFLLCYDRAVSNEWFTHLRFMGSFINDCAELPAGYVGAGVIRPMLKKRNYSLNAFLGGGWFVRSDWSSHFKNYYSPVMHKSGSVEWVIAPLPGIDLLIHPWRLPCSFIISFSTVIYVSQLCAGVQVNI